MQKYFLLIVLLGTGITLQGQDSLAKKKPWVDIGFTRGFTVGTPDSNFTFSIGARVQTMVESKFDLLKENNTIDFSIRRARIIFSGTAFKSKLTYRVQLCFSPRDIFADNEDEPNTLFLRDASISYNPNKIFGFMVGMTKLPGNRQRINSSGRLQLVERSNANNLFTLDRDKGIWFFLNVPGRKMQLKNTISITSGEGRISAPIDAGLCYTVRSEFFPLGKFQKDGEMSEADLVREPKPKLAIAAVYSFNHQTSRVAGQLGDYFYNGQKFDEHYFGGDFAFKWKGFSAVGSYYVRKAMGNAITFDPADSTQVRFAYSGQAILIQAGYLFTRKDEFAVRYSATLPDAPIRTYVRELHELVLGYSHYFLGHNLKLQTDVTWFFGPGRSQLVHRLSGVIAF